MKRLALVPLLAAAALAGCGSDDGDDGGEAANGSGDRVEVAATEFAFEPASIEAGGGATLVLRNDGELPHALEVEDAELETETIDGGESTELVLDLEPGSYTVYCPVGNHREQGMEGTLVVAGSGESAGGGGSRPADDDAYGYG